MSVIGSVWGKTSEYFFNYCQKALCVHLPGSTVTSKNSFSPAERDSRHRHPRDTADSPPLLPTVTVTRAAILILLLFFWSFVPVTTVTAAVVYEEGENHQ